jgi:hypothetical protein
MRLALLPLFIITLFGLTSCDKTIEPIPAYLRIDSFALKAAAAQGNNIHEISAVKLYVGNDFLGQFEIPCTIPVLQEGNLKVSMIPSVRLNGSRNQYISLNTLAVFDTVLTFKPGSITSAGTPSFKFKSNANVIWAEDFEGTNSTLIKFFSGKTDTTFVSNEPFQLNGRFSSNTRCMKIIMPDADTAKVVDMASFGFFSSIPTDGSDVILEFDINTSIPVQMALIRKNSNGRLYLPYVVVFPTDKIWKRFYINLVYELINQPANTDIQILLSPQKQAETRGDQTILIDNIRLTHLK